METPHNIAFDTPMGKFEIDSHSICDVVKYCMDSNDSSITLKHKSIFEFFGQTKPDNEYHAIRANQVGVYLKCLMEVLKENYDIVKMTDYSNKGDYEIPVSYHEFETSPKVTESLPLKANIFVTHKNKPISYVFSLMPYYESKGPQLEIEIFFDSSITSFRQFWDEVETYFDTKGPLVGEKFTNDWKFLKYNERTWDSIVIEKEKKDILNRNTINFIPNIEEYRKRGLPTSRGILITGPPGTGKTLCCETIMCVSNCATIYVSSDSVENIGDIKGVYSLAQRISPSIVIIEDIDTLGGLDRRERGTHPLLGEFLNCLNGMGNNSGVITIATTNYPEHLDVALSDRPGRFDVRLDFDLPNSKLRQHILNKYLEEIDCDSTVEISKS